MERDTSYFDDNLGEVDELHFIRCQALWRAVMLQAFTDMASKTKIRKLIRQKTISSYWLTHSSKNLFTVCDFAGMHPDTVMKRARRVALENGLNWKLPPGKSHKYEVRKKYRLKVRSKQQPEGMPEMPAKVYHGSTLTESSTV